MYEAFDDASIEGRLITNFRFAGDIVINAEEDEVGVLVDRLDTTTTRYRSVQTRQKWWQTTQMASKERSR